MQTQTDKKQRREMCVSTSGHTDSPRSFPSSVYFFSIAETLHKIQGENYSNSLTKNPLRKNLQSGLLEVSESRNGVYRERDFSFKAKGSESPWQRPFHWKGRKTTEKSTGPFLRLSSIIVWISSSIFSTLMKLKKRGSGIFWQKKSGISSSRFVAILSLKLLLLLLVIPSVSYGDQNINFSQKGTQSFNGLASFYGVECCKYNPSKACPTASGQSLRELVKRDIPYCASWDYAFGTRLKVTNLKNNKSVVVVVLDRGPNKRFHPRRIIDLSKSAFSKIANPKNGTVKVKVEVVK